MSQKFQVTVRHETEKVQVDVALNSSRRGGRSGQISNSKVDVTARDLLQAFSEQVGIPVESLKLAYENGWDAPITDLDTNINNYYKKFAVTIDKDYQRNTSVFMDDMSKLLEDPETADFNLKSGSKSFKVHKAILGARSKVFRNMFLSGMKEAVKGEAVITDVDVKTLEEILYYLYTGKLSGKGFVVKSLCYAATKYELDHLMDLICARIKAVKLEAGGLADVFISSEMFNKQEMYDIAMTKLKKNKEILKKEAFKEKVKDWPDLLYRITVSISTND